MTYIPDLTERDDPPRKLKRYIDEERDEIYIGKFDEGAEYDTGKRTERI